MERDEETGLSYHSARYYLPWLGRWLSSDPIGIGDGVNMYGYCSGRPIDHNDLKGEDGVHYTGKRSRFKGKIDVNNPSTLLF